MNQKSLLIACPAEQTCWHRIPNSSSKCENVNAWVTERAKIPLCASGVVPFCHIREAANKLTHFLFDWALVSSTRSLNGPTRQPDADDICALYAFHATVHFQEPFSTLGRVVEKTAEVKSIFIKGQGPFTMRQCVFATSCPLRGGWVGPPPCVPSHSRLNKHLFGWSSEHLLSLDMVLLCREQSWMKLLAPRFHKHGSTAFWGVF